MSRFTAATTTTLALLCALALACLCSAFRPAGFLPPLSSTVVAARQGGFARPTPSARSSSSSSKLFMNPPSRPTRENEPDEYFKSNLEKKEMGERLVDPQVLIALVGILTPFIAVGVLLGGGFLTR